MSLGSQIILYWLHSKENYVEVSMTWSVEMLLNQNSASVIRYMFVFTMHRELWPAHKNWGLPQADGKKLRPLIYRCDSSGDKPYQLRSRFPPKWSLEIRIVGGNNLVEIMRDPEEWPKFLTHVKFEVINTCYIVILSCFVGDIDYK